MKQRTFPFVYRCAAGHEAANTKPMTACKACVNGQPCTAELRRIVHGSRSTTPSTISPTQGATAMSTTKSTTRKTTTSKVGAVSTKPKPKQLDRKTTAAKKAPAKTAKKAPPKAGEKLGMGELRPLVIKTLKASNEPLTGSAIAKQLDRSAGAVNNQLAKLVELGEAVQVTEAPRRFQLA